MIKEIKKLKHQPDHDSDDSLSDDEKKSSSITRDKLKEAQLTDTKVNG